MLKYHIQTVELAATQTTISLNNIPQDYDDLYILASLRLDTGTTGTYISFNGSTSDFSGRYLYGDGSSPSSGSLGRYVGSASGSYTANTFNNTSIYISNYSRSTAKSFSVDNVTENNATRADQNIIAGLWNNTAAINSITIGPDSNSLIAGSSISLYGVRRGSDGRTEAASGGVVTTSGGYTIHTFNTSGTFVANRNLNAEYLIVAGGGAGGGRYGAGGGGAGGYRSSVVGEMSGGGAAAEATVSLNGGTSYPVIVGSGGAGVNTLISTGGSGNNSTFANITSFGGGGGGLGGGGSSPVASGIGGGSGGGSGTANNTRVAGSGTTGQGFNGGTGTAYTDPYAAGGGGGAGAAGGNGGALTGVGGVGVSSSITGSAIFRAGGGGGGQQGSTTLAGGNGGGGASSAGNGNAGSGTSNTGGGGGGLGQGASGESGISGNGGSGVVIIRYLTPA